jgi:hypothetical protein
VVSDSFVGFSVGVFVEIAEEWSALLGFRDVCLLNSSSVEGRSVRQT